MADVFCSAGMTKPDTHRENMQLIQRLESIANRDALTGTANRRALNAYTAAIWQQKRRWR